MSGSEADRPSKAFWPAIVVVALATLGLAMTSVPALALVPSLAGIGLLVLFKAPLRVPALTLLFLGLVLDNPADYGPWQSPFFKVGELLLVQLKKVIPIEALVVTGMDTALFFLVGIWLYRRARHKALDAHRWVKVPPELTLACFAAVAVILLAWGFGLATGGEMRWSLWQLMQMLHLPVVMLMFSVLLPGPSVAVTLGRIFLAAASIKAVIAIVLSRVFPNADFMTSHQDSILFAVASAHMAIHLLENPGKKSLTLNLLLQPLVVLAMMVNDRRLVWVQLAFAGAVVFYATDWSHIKFRLVRTAIAAVPFAFVYVAVGWHTSGTGIFRPVGTLRSMTDSQEDRSTQWRDLENYNLYSTLADNPLLGSGLGHPFKQVITLPDVTVHYQLEPYVPHNSMLGLWAYTGYVGFTVWWMVLVVAAFFAARGYRAARGPPERIATMTTIAALVIYMVHCYGDIGLAVWHGLLIVSTSSVVSAKIAVANGGCLEPAPATKPAKQVKVAVNTPLLPPSSSTEEG